MAAQRISQEDIDNSLNGGDDPEGEPLPAPLLPDSQRTLAMLQEMDRLQNHVDREGWNSPRGDALKNLMLEAIKMLLLKAFPEPDGE